MGLCCCTPEDDLGSEIQPIVEGIQVGDANRQLQHLRTGSRSLAYPNKQSLTGFDHPSVAAVPMLLPDSPAGAIHRTRLPYCRLDDREHADLSRAEVEEDADVEPQATSTLLGAVLRPDPMWHHGYTTATMEHEAKLRVALAAICLLLLATAGGSLVIYVVWRSRIASAAGADKPQAAAAETAKATALPRPDDAGRSSSFDCLPASPALVAASARLWCCLHRNMLCPAVARVSAETDKEPRGPTATPRAEHLAESPPFKCSEGWALGWSLAKKEWCCFNRAVGCPGDALPRAAASASETLSSGLVPARLVTSKTTLPSPAPSEAVFN